MKLAIAQIKAARMLLEWTQADMSARSGVSYPTIARLEAGSGVLPGRESTQIKIRKALEDAGIVFEAGGVRLKSGAKLEGVPMIGLAQCGLSGWYHEGILKATAPRPPDFPNPAAFAVIAFGRSMEPAGIFAGFVCYCDPDVEPKPGDAVYIRKLDETAAIKMWGGRSGGVLKYQGWIYDNGGKVGTSYVEEIPETQAAIIAPVIYVRRRV